MLVAVVENIIFTEKDYGLVVHLYKDREGIELNALPVFVLQFIKKPS